MTINCPRQTTTRAAQRLKFELITASREPNRIMDDHYNRITMIRIAWIIGKRGRLIVSDRIDGEREG
jgi:hypothetical protein